MVVGVGLNPNITPHSASFTDYTHDEVEAVINLLYRMGEEPDEANVLAWLPAYRSELTAVAGRRLTPVSNPPDDVTRQAMPL